MFGHRLEANRVIVDKIMVEPVMLDHQMQNAVKERHVAPRLDRHKEVEQVRANGREARVDHNNLRAPFACLPK